MHIAVRQLWFCKKSLAYTPSSLPHKNQNLQNLFAWLKTTLHISLLARCCAISMLGYVSTAKNHMSMQQACVQLRAFYGT